MKKLTYSILVILLSMASSCNNLDEEVFNQVVQEGYPYQPDEIYAVVGPVYTTLRGMCGFNTFFLQETCSDEMVQPANASGWDDGGVFRRMHLHTWNSEQNHVIDAWNTLFRGVIHTNRIIEQLDNDVVPMPENITKTALIAEIKTARAYYYWQLCDNFGDVPIVTEVNTDLPAKNSRQEVYDFIVAELQANIPHLSEARGQAMFARFNKWAGLALLANVYLNAEVYTGTPQWQNCVEICDELMLGGFALESDYSTIFRTNNFNSSEIIFAIPFDDVYATGWNMHLISLHSSLRAKFNLQESPYGAGSAKAVPQFIDTYDEDDARLDHTWLNGPQFSSTGETLRGAYDQQGMPLIFTKELRDGIYTLENEGYRIGKYEILPGSRGNLKVNFPVFRYAQVYMMKAESLLRLGRADEAAQLVSEVRGRAFARHPEKAGVSGNQLLANSRYQYGYVEDYNIVDPGNASAVAFGGMYDELGWEFACEQYRRRDMIRFGLFTQKSWLSHRPNGDYRSLFPIPLQTVLTNPNLEQNPNY